MEERIEKQHNIAITECFNSRADFEAHEKECEKYKREYEEIKTLLITERPDDCFCYGHFDSFGPQYQFITYDALKKEDWPNNIAANSIYIAFYIDFKTKTFEARSSGHIYLTKADQDKSYLCMCSMKQAHKALGGKWMRKSKFKSAQNIVEKMNRFYNEVMASVTKATGGYHYKQMLVNIY